MEAGKVISNVIIFGGIGVMAYLLLKKKPVVEQKPTTTTIIDGVEEGKYKQDQAKFCSEAIFRGGNIVTKPDVVKQCVSLQSGAELKEPLVDQSVLNLSTNYASISWDASAMQYYTPTGDIKANNCIELDWVIKYVGQQIQGAYASNLPAYMNRISFYEKVKQDAEAKFKKFNCRDKIEAQRTKDFVDIQSKGDIQAEQSILTKSFTEQKTYIILGGLVLLMGFYIVVKK